jgi:hypothetical protein
MDIFLHREAKASFGETLLPVFLQQNNVFQKLEIKASLT